jgi:spermidine synthase
MVGPGWRVAAVASGAVALGYETCWMRRLSLVLGGSALGSAVAVGAFMGGMAGGAWWADRLRTEPRRAWGALELAAAGGTLLAPALLAHATPSTAPWIAACCAAPLGATWPVVARQLPAATATSLYAWNTLGAVLGVLIATFFTLPAIGVTGTEWLFASAGVALAAGVQALDGPDGAEAGAPAGEPGPALARAVGAAAFLTGFASLGLEVVWFRLAAVGLGATVQTFGLVLAVFLATVALGAALGRRLPTGALAWALAAHGALALIGAQLWAELPYGVAAAWRTGGPDALLPATALLAAAAMGGAPAASGAAFALCVRASPGSAAGRLYAANTAGGIAGAWLAGLWALPTLELRGATALFALAPAVAGAAIRRGVGPLVPALVLIAISPAWDARLYAVGIYARISDFAEPSAPAITRFSAEGWRLLSYDQGLTGAVAVGESTRTGNRWLSINGKVDASTGDDMPTQTWSARLPIGAVDAARVGIIGLASGITAGTALQQPGVRAVDLYELEPAVVAASRWFDPWSGAPLDDPRTTLILGDARRELARPGPAYDALISEPSNPWITGVSNLFTREYWQLGAARLRPGGAFCQWIQLYGMDSDAFRGLVRTFLDVFPHSWLFETIPGSDIVLVGAATPLDPARFGLAPRLGPAQLRWLAGSGWRNTDDHPRVEFLAPRALHRDTAPANRALLDHAARQPAGP